MLVRHCFMIMLVVVAVLTMNMNMGMAVCMLVGMNCIAMAVFMGMGAVMPSTRVTIATANSKDKSSNLFSDINAPSFISIMS